MGHQSRNPRIEELRDDFDENLRIDGAAALDSKSSSTAPFPATTAPSSYGDSATPSLPPQIASVRSHTADEIVHMMQKSPLFMTSLDNAGDDEEENIELEAMKALQYEGTPTEIAQGFRERGNEMARLKRWSDGKEFYSKGISVFAQEEKTRKKGLAADNLKSKGTVVDGHGSAEDSEYRVVQEACFINRALCNLELKNYRSTLHDCASTLSLNPKNVKALYRSSLALLALDKTAEAADACERGLTLDPSNASLKALEPKIEARGASLKANARVSHEREVRAKQERIALAAALRLRKIQMRMTNKPPEMEDATVHLAPDPLSLDSTLYFPVVLLYPLHAQSDFIKAFPETDTVPHHLDYIFPLPWDQTSEYAMGKVEIYMETKEKGLAKVGRKVTLGKVLGDDKLEVIDGVVKMFVVPSGKSKEWIEEMKMKAGKK